MTFKIENFPLLARHIRTSDEFVSILEIINCGLEEGKIWNVDFKSVKDDLGRALWNAWNKDVHYKDKNEYDKVTEEELALFWDINHSSMHDVLSSKKKLDKSEVKGEFVARMRALIDEAHPLAVPLLA